MGLRPVSRTMVAALVFWSVVRLAIGTEFVDAKTFFCVDTIQFVGQSQADPTPLFPRKIASEIEALKNNVERQFKEKCLPREDAHRLAEKLCEQLSQVFLSHKYITTRATVAGITDGTVTIKIIIGQIADILIENADDLWLRKSYIEKRIRIGAPAGSPLNFDRLESHLRLLRLDPSIDHIEASLKPLPPAKRRPGMSDLGVRVKEASHLHMRFGTDNYSAPSIGSKRYGMDVGVRNPTGWGDQLKGAYYRTRTDGGEFFDISYMLPVNALNGTLLVRGGRYWTTITDSEFDDLGLDGEKVVAEANYRQPLIRAYTHELALSLGFKFDDGQTFVFGDIGTPFGIGPDEDGVSRTSVFKLGQDFTWRDARRVLFVQSQFNIGSDLFNATTNSDPIPDGRFFSWMGQGYIGYRLSDMNALIMNAALQLSDDGLLASEQFVIGGAQSVRGYRQNARIGDNGFRISIEDRIPLATDKAGASILDIRPFIDMGKTWNVSDNPNEQEDQRFLMGAGVAVSANLGGVWEPMRDLWVRLDYGYPIIELDDKGDDLQDEGFYFSIYYEPDKLLKKLF